MSILDEIDAENTRQIAEGYDAQHDDAHSLRDLAEHVIERAQMAYVAADAAAPDREVAVYEKRLIQTAAICIAAIKSSRRRLVNAG